MVQAKAGATRIDSEVTDADRFRETMVAMLGGENLRQHREAAEALAGEQPSLTYDQAGKERFRHNLTAAARIVPLHVTLENLAGIGSQPWRLADAGLSENRDLPWIVSVGHLELLLEFFELPALFIHFLTRAATSESHWPVSGERRDRLGGALRRGRAALGPICRPRIHIRSGSSQCWTSTRSSAAG